MNIAVHAATTRTPVEKLVEKLPHDTLGFLATSGGDTLKPDFDKSALGKIWHEPSVQTFYQQIKEQIQPLIQNNFINTKDTRTGDIIMRLAKSTFSCPVVLAVCERPGAKENPIYGFLLADVGDRKADLEAAFNELEATDPKNKAQIVSIDAFTMHKGTESEAPGYLWGFIGNHLLFAVNDLDGGSPRSPPAIGPFTWSSFPNWRCCNLPPHGPSMGTG